MEDSSIEIGQQQQPHKVIEEVENDFVTCALTADMLGLDCISYLYESDHIPAPTETQTAITIPCITTDTSQFNFNQYNTVPYEHFNNFNNNFNNNNNFKNNFINNNTTINYKEKRLPPFSYVEHNSKTLPEIPQPVFELPPSYIENLEESLFKPWIFPELDNLKWYNECIPPEMKVPRPLTQEFATIWRTQRESSTHMTQFSFNEPQLSSLCFTLVQGYLFPVGTLKRGVKGRGIDSNLKRLDLDYRIVQTDEEGTVDYEYFLFSRDVDLQFDGPLFTFEDLTKIEHMVSNDTDMNELKKLERVVYLMKQPLKEEHFEDEDYPSFVQFLKGFEHYEFLKDSKKEKAPRYAVQQSFELWATLFKSEFFAWESTQKNYYRELKAASDPRIEEYLRTLPQNELIKLSSPFKKRKKDQDQQQLQEQQQQQQQQQQPDQRPSSAEECHRKLLYNFFIPLILNPEPNSNISRETQINNYTNNLFKKLFAIRKNYKDNDLPTIFDLLLFRLDFTKAFIKWLKENINHVLSEIYKTAEILYKQRLNDNNFNNPETLSINNETPSSVPSLPYSTAPSSQSSFTNYSLPNLSLSSPIDTRTKNAKQRYIAASKGRSRKKLAQKFRTLIVPPPIPIQNATSAEPIVPPPLPPQPPKPNTFWFEDFFDQNDSSFSPSLSPADPVPPPPTASETPTNNKQEALLPSGIRSGIVFSLPTIQPKKKVSHSFPKRLKLV